ncbi:MAG TPA: ion channel [bacterium]|nr:ion channel [bacterium]
MSSNPNTTPPKREGTQQVRPPGLPGAPTITRVGIGGSRWGDLYHVLMTTTWPRFLLIAVASYVVLNALFGAAYFFSGGIENSDGTFLQAFFFSVQTFGTIGYGKMSPATSLASVVMTAESITSLISTALMTGLIFAKFARPTARVMWSNVVVITRREGTPVLMFRMANERSNQIVDANFRLTVLMDETTREGERLRRLHDLPLLRSGTPTFSLTFTAISPIVPGSPLHGKTVADLQRLNPQLICTLIGLDDTMNATVHARKSWSLGDWRWNMRLVDILSALRDGDRVVDYHKFHDVEPDGLPAVSVLGDPA